MNVNVINSLKPGIYYILTFSEKQELSCFKKWSGNLRYSLV